MDNKDVDVNCNNNSEMEVEFNNCTDNKVCVYETVISGGFIDEQLYDTDNKQRNIHNYVAIKDQSINNQGAIGFFNEKPCDTEYKPGNLQNYLSIKDENIDDPNEVIPETKLITDCTDNKVFVIRKGYIKQEPCGMKDERRSIQNYVSIKDENIDDLNEVIPETKLITDCTDNKVFVIRKGYIKQEPCGMKDERGSIQNHVSIKDENIDDLTVVAQETEFVADGVDNKVCVYDTVISGGYIKEEPCNTSDESGSIHNNIDMKGCKECGEEYDLYCLKCPMLIRIFDSNNPNGTDNTVRGTLPKNFLDICETQSGLGIVALRAIPKGVVFGPLTKDEVISKLKNKEPKRLNWMQYIRRADKSSHQNLVPFQYEDKLYHRSERHINVGDELLVRWDSDRNEDEINDMKDSYWTPGLGESLDDSYACTFCCVGYKSISHLKAHNSTCIEKRNKKDFCKETIQCDICKIYLDKKEYSDYHMNRCYKSNGKCDFNLNCGRNHGRALPNDDRPFSCTLCPYKTKTQPRLKQHIAVHNDDKPFACTICPYKTKTKSNLKQHSVSHNVDKPFACTFCPHKTTTRSKLKQHIATHNVDKPFACTICPYKTKSKPCLKFHITTHHGDKSFTCTLCPYKANRKSILKLHMAVHNGNKQFACTLCSHKATTKSNLKLHIAIHNGDKPFACTLCSYKTTRKWILKRHIAVHNEDKPFACTLCPYRGKTKSNLKKHTAIHDGDKP